MRISFSLDDMRYLRIGYGDNGAVKNFKLALQEKNESDFIAVMTEPFPEDLDITKPVTVEFICNSGLYKTTTFIRSVNKEGSYTYLTVKNPETLDYQQNREFYRIIASYDCIYMVDDEAYNAVTYDISAGGVSILSQVNAISKEDMHIAISLPDKEVRAHLKFMRCEMAEDDYKLSFEFTDLSKADYDYLLGLCVNTQLSDI